MKKWKMQITGTTTVEVFADSYDEAIDKIEEEATSNKQNLDWNNLKINSKTIEVTNEEN